MTTDFDTAPRNGLARPDNQGIHPKLPFTARTEATVWRLVVIALAIFVWAMVPVLGIVDEFYISSPIDVASAWVTLITDSAVWSAFVKTGQAILVAFVSGTTAGIIAGFILGLFTSVRRAYYPIVAFLLSTPKVVFVPVFLLVFGIGWQSVAAFGAFQAFFYVVVAVVGGVDLVEQKHMKLARAFRASWLLAFVEIILPASLPGLISSLWYGLKHAITGALIVELFISASGLGQLIRNYMRGQDMASLIALMGTVAVTAVIIGVLLNRLEGRES